MGTRKTIPQLIQYLASQSNFPHLQVKKRAIALSVLLLVAVWMESCSPSPETDPELSSAAPTGQTESVSPSSDDALTWEYSKDWWREPRVWALQPGAGWDDESVLGSFNFPNYEAANVSVVSWFEGSKVAIDELHKRGITVVGQDGMIWMFQADRTNPELFWDENAGIYDFAVEDPPELAVAALTDPFGNPIYAEMFGFADGKAYLQYSVPHPAWQDYMADHMRSLIDAGVDGYLIDELAYGTVFYPDFNPHMLQEFNGYLEQTFEPEDLEVLLASVGVDDLASFDYAEVIRNALPAGTTALAMEDWNWELPLYTLYSRFLALENYQAAAALIQTGREYAAETAGKEIPFSANINTLASPNAFLFVPLLDMIDLEFYYADLNYFRNGRGTAPLKLTRYFDKPAQLLTSVSAEPDLREWGTEGTVDLYATMIADAVSSGGGFYVERIVEQDMAALAPYYRFKTDHPDLFEDLKSLDPQVAVLLLWENVVADPFQIRSYYGASSLLADSGVQFDAIFAAQEYLSQGELPMYPAPDFPLSVEQLMPYPVVLIPEMNDLSESHAAVLLDYVNAGGVLVTYLVDEYGFEFQHENDPGVTALLAMIRSGAVNNAGGRIFRLDQNLTREYGDNPDPFLRQEWLGLLSGLGFGPEVRYEPFPMLSAQVYDGDGQVVVHLVNYNWDRNELITEPINDLQVEIAIPDSFDRAGLSVSLHTPGKERIEPVFEVLDSGIVITIPELQIWSVISIVD